MAQKAVENLTEIESPLSRAVEWEQPIFGAASAIYKNKGKLSIKQRQEDKEFAIVVTTCLI